MFKRAFSINFKSTLFGSERWVCNQSANIEKIPDNRNRNGFKYFVPMPTRWMDNDFFGHVNNVQYYSYFDTAVNKFVIESGHHLLEESLYPDMGCFVVHSNCNYYQPVSFPQMLEIGLKVSKLGNSSVTYTLGVFPISDGLKKDSETLPNGLNRSVACATGEFIHVYVNKKNGTPICIPECVRQTLEKVKSDS